MIVTKLFILILVCGLSFVNPAIAKKNAYLAAKKALFSIYQSNPESFYCKKPFNQKGELLFLEPELISPNAKKISWEHLVPLSHLAADRLCWKQPICHSPQGKAYKGKRCCHSSDSQFQRMEADMHNLVPTIPSINHARRDYAFAIIPPAEDLVTIPSCDIVIDKVNHQIQPPTHTRGMIARAYLYMHQQYQTPLTHAELMQYQQWHRLHPPSDWEKIRNLKIAAIQGNRNPFIQ